MKSPAKVHVVTRAIANANVSSDIPKFGGVTRAGYHFLVGHIHVECKTKIHLSSNGEQMYLDQQAE